MLSETTPSAASPWRAALDLRFERRDERTVLAAQRHTGRYEMVSVKRRGGRAAGGIQLQDESIRVGIGGPVGSGKTALTLALCKALRDRYEVAVVTNDIYTEEDASINLEAVSRLSRRFPRLDIVFVESGGDNLAATLNPIC